MNDLFEESCINSIELCNNNINKNINSYSRHIEINEPRVDHLFNEMNEIPRKYLKGKFPFYLNHNYILWTFNTGSSERITNNKSILSNYT